MQRVTGYVSENRFRLMMLAGAVVLALMMAGLYATVGFVPMWAGHAVPASP
jgi:hypothetical protein